MKKIILKNLADTRKLAKDIAKKLRGSEVIALTGPLGSGKTTFVQFLAKELGVKRTVKSPSFIILQLFNLQPASCKLRAKLLCHVDCYRLKNADELDALGLGDYLGKSNVITVIEWAEKIKKALPPKTIWLKFKYAKDGRSVLMRTL